MNQENEQQTKPLTKQVILYADLPIGWQDGGHSASAYGHPGPWPVKEHYKRIRIIVDLPCYYHEADGEVRGKAEQ